ncbi:MAG: hypothetical protein UDM11_04225 [Oscillospiraceae bacterium]|nr:hypothetical protein [Oscillospiraceae bacterium]
MAKDTRSPGKSLANTYPAYTDIDWQISLAEDATATVTLPTNLTENELAAAMDAGLSLSLDRDTQRGYLNPEKFPNPYQGGPLDSWKTQRDTQMFQVDDYGFAFDDDGKVSLVLYLNISCYFANRSGSVDYSAPHSNGGAYLDLCGYYTLRVTADGKDIASCHAKVVPYDSFRTVYELYDDLEALAAMDTDLYVSKESMGQTTTDGYDMPYLIVADSKESVDKWLAYTDLVESDPDLALTKLANGDFDDLRVPMFASNVHSNENAAVNGILEFAHLLLENETINVNTLEGFTDAGKELLAQEMAKQNVAVPEQIKNFASYIGFIRGENGYKANGSLYSGQLDLAAYYNVQENRVNVKELLGDVFMVIVPEQNIEGYEHMTRTTGQGYDPNRDEANQTLFEDANAMALVNKFNPMVFTEIHGRVEAMLIEPCTPPHEPNYEYDLIAKQFIQLGEAVGMGAIANNPEHSSFEMPYRDYLRVDNDSPSGVAWTEPWDDMTTAYGSQFPVLIGTAGITWELPVYSDIASELVVPYGLMTQAMYIQANKITMLENQAKLFSRGVNNTNSNELVAPWYVDQYDRPGTQTELMRPVYDGEGQNGNFYPECYIIPMDSANQKNLYDAAAEMKYLTRNDVKVNVASKEFTYDGVTYPAGTMVVSMYQAKRSLANSQLFDGTFINVWQGLYSESFAQRSNARGYDRVIVAEPAAYKTIMAACPETINYTQALTYLAAFATQFEGVENADVIIDNVSNDSAAAVNALLRAGKTVAMITEGSEKGNFICSYEDFMTVAKDYVLTATGVYGAGIKAAVILNPQVYLPGKPADNTSGYVETTLRSGSYNYRFDWLALTAMGFTMTDDLTKANVIVGSRALSDDALAAVKAGTPYMGYSNDAITGRSAFMQELGVEISSCDKGTDFLGRVVYPNNTLVNATYINEADDVMYEYGTNWFTKIPEGATVLVQNAGKAPLQGCICLTDDELTEQFNQYNNGVVGFEYQNGDLDMALFANVLNHKIHQTDEYTFISNFIFSRSLTETAYEGVAQPENPNPVNPGKPEEPGKPDVPKTGDTSSIIVWVLAASFTVVMIPMTVTLKRKAR